MKKFTAEWVRKAERDFLAANDLSQSPHRLHDQMAFFAQQSAEKYLKAVLQEHGITIPRTHDLKVLVGLLLPTLPNLKSLNRGADFLTRFAVETRYPGEGASKRQAVASLRWAAKIRQVVRSQLGLASD